MEDQKSIYSRLQKLLANNVVVRNVGGKKLKVVDTDGIQSSIDKNNYKDRWARVRSSGYNTYGRDFTFNYQTTRLELFREYEVMDSDPIISSVLDIYADECTVPNEFGNVLAIKSSNQQIKQILDNLFYDILNIEFNLWSWTRGMCKYGDFFLKLNISPEYGVYTVQPMSSYEVQRIEGIDAKDIGLIKFRYDSAAGGCDLENYEVAHFRLLSDSNFAPYGRSIIEGGRRQWKQLCLLEDAMLLNRIMKAPERRVYKIDIGNIPPAEVENYVEKLVNQMKKTPYVDERTGEYNLRYNLMNMIEDIYIPVRGNESGTQIDTLPGMEFNGIDDVEYVKNKMLAAFKVPKPFIGYDEGIGGKSVLAGEDLRFARTITRIQRMIVSELTKIAVIHLFCQGYTDASLVDFELSLSNPSTIYEQEKIQLWKDKVDLATDMLDSKMFSKEWVYKTVLNLTEDESLSMKNEIITNKKDDYRVSQIEEKGNDPFVSRQSVSGDGELSDFGGDDAGLDFGGGGGESSSADEDLIDQLSEEFGVPSNQSPLEEKKEYVRPERDQSGEKDAREYPFGENPLGKHTEERSRTNPIKHEFRGKGQSQSPLALQEMLKNLNNKLNINESK